MSRAERRYGCVAARALAERQEGTTQEWHVVQRWSGWLGRAAVVVLRWESERGGVPDMAVRAARQQGGGGKANEVWESSRREGGAGGAEHNGGAGISGRAADTSSPRMFNIVVSLLNVQRRRIRNTVIKNAK